MYMLKNKLSRFMSNTDTVREREREREREKEREASDDGTTTMVTMPSKDDDARRR